MNQRDEGYMPPEPSGPEPDLGGGQPQQQPQQPQGQPPPPPPGYSPPYGYPQPGYTPPSPPGWQPPPGYPSPGGYYSWGPPPPPQPDNGPAVAGFVLSMVAGGLWLFSAGLSSIVSIVCAILGVIYSRRGKQKVQSGETTKQKDLAQVGLILGWVMVGLATLSTVIWILVFVLAATSDSFDQNLNNELDDSQASALRLGLQAVRLAARLVS